MHDVDLALLEDLLELAAQQRIDNVVRLRRIRVARQGAPDANNLERDVCLGANIAVDDRRRAHHIAGDDGHLMTPPRQLRGLSVDVLGDPAEVRVVVVGDDGDPHAPCIVASPAALALALGECQADSAPAL